MKPLSMVSCNYYFRPITALIFLISEIHQNLGSLLPQKLDFWQIKLNLPHIVKVDNDNKDSLFLKEAMHTWTEANIKWGWEYHSIPDIFLCHVNWKMQSCRKRNEDTGWSYHAHCISFTFVYFTLLKLTAASVREITGSLTFLISPSALGHEVILGKGHNSISLSYI